MRTGVEQGRWRGCCLQGLHLEHVSRCCCRLSHIPCWPSQSSVDRCMAISRKTASRILLKASMLAFTQLGSFRIELI